MRNSKLILAAAIFLVAPLIANAAAGPTGACNLVKTNQIAALNLQVEGEPYEDGVDVPKGASGAPSDIWSSICTFNLGKKGAQFMSVAIHNFSTPVTVAELEAWEEETSEKQGGYSDVTKSQSGNITCEIGQYDYKPAKDGKPAVVQYYEACDELVGGRQRLVINLQTDDKAVLPPVEKIRDLLDVALKHMEPMDKPAPAKSHATKPLPAA
jgi:hypothetical protein